HGSSSKPSGNIGRRSTATTIAARWSVSTDPRLAQENRFHDGGDGLDRRRGGADYRGRLLHPRGAPRAQSAAEPRPSAAAERGGDAPAGARARRASHAAELDGARR